jgi:hypothetical protein
MPQAVREPGQHDEEREKRDQREVSEVAGMDETVRIDANRYSLDDVEQAPMAPVLVRMLSAPFG